MASLKHPPGPPITVGNLRQLGVRGLLVSCRNPQCRHEATMSVDDYADEIEVPSFAPRMVCSKCGGRSRCPAELERNALSATEASGMTDAPQHHEFAAPCGCDV